ncbi:molybdopterin molybdotransferase [Asanoa ferruginea]|uniref:Molybdopterin molybdenumtransferase n=2 Tax=Asanoa ferruginea TaxID=53367 RepID=A0A3D9ZHH6_9ACTN|nr:molybdopterin molybdotransferase [Asanoa ferruginea]GIF46949.1 molybdopterin molybdenumtransferase MoeA [Asanoa ferruginea]
MTAETVATTAPTAWDRARTLMYEAGRAALLPPVDVLVDHADGLTLAHDLVTLTALPAFPTSSVDGYAVRGPAPWTLVGKVLAGNSPEPLREDGTAVEIATGGMLPTGADAVLRVEESTRTADGRVTGQLRETVEWRRTGEEAEVGELLVPAGTPVDPGVLGLAASCGYDKLAVHPRPRAALRIFGDELLTQGPPGDGRVRDALGPNVPALLRRYGCAVAPGAVVGPVEDTLEAHVAAIRSALAESDLVCTTGGTMHGPVDHLHPALAALGASYLVNTVAVRPGFPMLVARITGDDGRARFIAGLPGNPQSALVALASLVEPLLAGLRGRPMPTLGTVVLAEPVPGRGDYTHLALVHVDATTGSARPVRHVGSAMLRGLARAHGFAAIAPGTSGEVGARVPFVPLPLLPGERP